jgi:glycosyltransferase involved in cell wall biosynthesis
MKISYAVTVCNELIEIQRLISFLLANKYEEDEIIVQQDNTKLDGNVYTYLTSQKIKDNIKFIQTPLNNDFASFKNNLTENCTGDYIYQIDADEMISKYCIKNLGMVLEYNPIDVLMVSRINTVDGLTQEHTNKWGWQVNNQGWVNFPDPQFRIYKNNSKIKWKNKVHEVLEGYKTISQLPTDKEWCLIHKKDIKRQETQNKFYETI